MVQVPLPPFDFTPDIFDRVLMVHGQKLIAVNQLDYISYFIGGTTGTVPSKNDTILMEIGQRVVPVDRNDYMTNFLGGLQHTRPDRFDRVMMVIGNAAVPVTLDDFLAGGWSSVPVAPANTSLPTITGLAQQGTLLTAGAGSWSGTPAIYTYQWKRDGADISEATASTYTLVVGDVGTVITVTVTASNVAGAAMATSLPTATVVIPPPSNTVLPVISGTTTQGQTLSTTNGTWLNSPSSYAYQWKRDGSSISGATSSTYLLAPADVGTVITVTVTATNTTGSTPITSAGTAAIAAAPTAPVNTVAPAVTGTPTEGQTLSVTDGTWTGTPTSYTYQWKRGASNISGATANTYLLVVGDVGSTISCVVTATNVAGSTPATSNSTSTIAAAPTAPVNTVAPVISGTAQEGFTLSTTNGTWTQSPTSYTYQWKRGASDIAGATASTYALVSADVGSNISVVVTAVNGIGSTPQASSVVGPILIAAPVNTVAPAITGTPTQGQTLTSSTGTWTNSPSSYAYQWKRDGTNISGATSSTYLLTATDVGCVITVAVVATNAGGSSSPSTSSGTATIAAAPGAIPWNTSLKGSNITISGTGDVVATQTAFVWQPVIGTTALSGSGYFDVQIVGPGGADWQVGVANASLDLNNYLSSTANACGIAKDGLFQISTGNIAPSISMTWTSGTTVRVEYSGDDIRYSKNGGATWTQWFDVSSVTGTRYPAVAMIENGAVVTAIGSG